MWDDCGDGETEENGKNSCLWWTMLVPVPNEPFKVRSQFLKTTKIYFLHHVCERAKSLQSCLSLCEPMDCSPLGSSVHGILQAWILKWVAMPSSRGFSQPCDGTCVSCLLHWQVGSVQLMPPGKPSLPHSSVWNGRVQWHRLCSAQSFRNQVLPSKGCTIYSQSIQTREESKRRE